jgi:hypothetical protein
MSMERRLDALKHQWPGAASSMALCARCATPHQYERSIALARATLATTLALAAPEARCPECGGLNLRGALSFEPDLAERTQRLEEVTAAFRILYPEVELWDGDQRKGRVAPGSQPSA